MKILFVSAEVGPFVSVGGLSQVCYFLPRALAKQGNEVAIFTPKFGAMDPPSSKDSGGASKTHPRWKLKEEHMGLTVEDKIVCNVKSYQKNSASVKTYFLENREYYELRANVFGYSDDHVRFMLLCKGCLEWLIVQREKGGWWPDMIHLNDWHTAYLAELARNNPRYEEIMKKITIGMTVHNFTFQGNFDFKYCLPADRDNGSKPLESLFSDKLVKQNALLRGIKYTDAVTTVSPTHAREVMTPEYSEGLESILLSERAKISGILNGLDTVEFDPSSDPLIQTHFDQSNYQSARAKNKKLLQVEFDLPTDPRAFLMAYSGRLTSQKGLTILIEAMKHLLAEHPDFQLIVLGGGDDSYRKALTDLRLDYPKQVGLHLLPNFKLPRKIFAGTDVLLIPSLYEPGGIVALEALRYGAVPIVRRTGGLNDIVEDFDQTTLRGNGFSFTTRDAWALFGAIIKAATTYQNAKVWKKLVSNCLAVDFSWDEVAKLYVSWYRRTIATRKRMLSLQNFVRMEQ